MSNTTYVDYTTPAVNAEWLNEINDHVWNDSPVTGTIVHDASKIAYLPDGISAVPTTVRSKLRSLELADYTALRAFTGNETHVQVIGTGIAGLFKVDVTDTTSADNGGTILVDAIGRRWKRLMDFYTSGHEAKIGYAPSIQSSAALRRTWNSWISLSSITARRTVNVLGDSISFGAGAGTTQDDVAKHGWVRILQKMLNLDHGGNNYGFVSAYSANGTGAEIHTVTQYQGVAGVYWTVLQDAAGGHLPNGWAMLSHNVGDKLRFSLPPNFGKFQVWYDGTQTGAFEVAINGGAALTTVTTNGTGTGLDKTAALSLVGFSNGSCFIDITVTSGVAAICGIAYLKDDAGFSLNNFSRDGRKGQYVAEGVISAMCKGAGAVIWALGANDVTATGSAQTEVLQRLSWLAQYANQYGCSVVIVDTLWTYPESNWLRAALKNTAKSIPGAVYVPVPSLLSPDGTIQTAAQLNNRNFTYDGTHLTAQGNRMLAETVAQYINTSVKSKRLANELNSAWETVYLTGATNVSTAVGLMSCYRIAGDRLDICININAPAAGTKITTIPLVFKSLKFGGNFLSDPDATGKTAIITIANNGDITIYANAASPGYPAVIYANFSVSLNVDSDLQPYQ